MFSPELTALELNEDDIAGHCLTFHLSVEGVLALRRAGLISDCSDTRDVIAWLAQVEQDWDWDHSHAVALHAHADQSQDECQQGVPWTCPLHCLQQYHDNDCLHQASSPSWQRNIARFRHITGVHQYVHPTVRHAKPPLPLCDSCVAAAER
jgi:hypothetical protein